MTSHADPRWHPLTLLLPFLLPSGILGETVGRYIAFRQFNVDGAAYGGLIGPVDDAARFVSLHLNGGITDGLRLLSPQSVAAMQRITARGSGLDVGLGWYRQRRRPQEDTWYLEHLGGGAGFFNAMRIYPEQKLGLIVMGNATSYDHGRGSTASCSGFELMSSRGPCVRLPSPPPR